MGMNLIQAALTAELWSGDVDPEQGLVDIIMILCVKALNTVGGTQGKCILGKTVEHHWLLSIMQLHS